MESGEGKADLPAPGAEGADKPFDDEAIHRAALRQFDLAASDPHRSGVVEEVFANHLAGEIDAATFRIVQRAAEVFLGAEAFATLGALTSQSDYDDEIESLEVSDETKQWLGRIVALYGSRLETAYNLTPGAPGANDWRSFHDEVVRDVRSGTYRITINLRKANHETIAITGEPSSIVRLTRNVLRTLLRVGDLDDVPEHDLASLQRALDDLQALLPSGSAPGRAQRASASEKPQP